MVEQTYRRARAESEKLWFEVIEELEPASDALSASPNNISSTDAVKDAGAVRQEEGGQPPTARRKTASDLTRRQAFTFFRDPVLVTREIDSGIPVRALSRAIELGLLRQAEIRIVLPESTFRRRKMSNEALTRDESDKFARVLQVMEFAAETFGTTEKAHRWLRQLQKRLDGKTPLELLGTSLGAQAVRDRLVQIAHGIAA